MLSCSGSGRQKPRKNSEKMLAKAKPDVPRALDEALAVRSGSGAPVHTGGGCGFAPAALCRDAGSGMGAGAGAARRPGAPQAGCKNILMS